MDACFSKSFLKLIIGNFLAFVLIIFEGVQPNLNDLEDIEPELISSWRWMLSNNVDDLEQPFIYELDIFGTKIVQELVDDGSNVIVNEENKDVYIQEMITSKALIEVSEQIESFKKGFYEIVPKDVIKIFSSSELESLISGQSEIDVNDFKKYLNVSELSGDKIQLVQWFKDILDLMDQSLLANLIFFITGNFVLYRSRPLFRKH